MSTTRAPLVKEVAFDTARELFAALSPGGKFEELRDRESDYLVFRGHSHHNFELVPAALRLTTGGNALHKLAGSFPNGDYEKNSNVLQLLRELSVLRHFFRVADEIGLPLPEDSQTLRSYLEAAFLAIVRARKLLGEGTDSEIGVDWPSDGLLSLMALAQHHGIPTRLLDWTRRIHVAMYFAASEKLRRFDEKEGLVAIWAMNLHHLDHWHYKQVIHEGNSRAEKLIQFVTAPRAGNANLHAQSGVFTLFNRRRFVAGNKVDRRPLDQVLVEFHDQFWNPQYNYPVFYKFMMPSAECRELLWLLDSQDVSPAAIFPSFDGVTSDIVHAAKLREQWELMSHDATMETGEVPIYRIEVDEKTGFASRAE
jgi:hypothetical protein